MENEFKYGKKVTLVGTAVNVLLSIVKLIIGLFAGSLALIADGFHSLSDLASDLVVFVGLSFAEKPDDKGHHFGHGKFETFSAFIVGVFLAIAGIAIGKNSVLIFISVYRGEQLSAPGLLALFAAISSIIFKELLFRYTKRAGEKINSPSIIANAWHHRSDAFSSIGAALGIAGAIFLGGKWLILDPLAGVIVAVILVKEALRIIKVNLSQLLDASLGPKSMEDIYRILKDIPECNDPHNIRTRMVGKRAVISLHIRVLDSYSIKKGHDIAHNAEDRLKEHFGSDSIITVHIEPYDHCDNPLQKKV